MRCLKQSVVLRSSGLPFISRAQEKAMLEQRKRNQALKEQAV